MEHILSLSYGKDSLACLGAIEELGLQLDRIIHAEVWATDAILGDLPEMVEFKKKADAIIKDRYGIEVEHIRSTCNFESHFYQPHTYGGTKVAFPSKDGIYGFPIRGGMWCNSRLKVSALSKIQKGAETVYIGIANDDPKRFGNLNIKKRSPLVEAGWTEEVCRKWCEKNDLLSPIYATALRGGCWFCPNQSIGCLRLLRKNHSDLWALLLKWDNDSPVSFRADGHTVHDFEKRFALEDKGVVPCGRKFRWKMLEAVQE